MLPIVFLRLSLKVHWASTVTAQTDEAIIGSEELRRCLKSPVPPRQGTLSLCVIANIEAVAVPGIKVLGSAYHMESAYRMGSRLGLCMTVKATAVDSCGSTSGSFLAEKAENTKRVHGVKDRQKQQSVCDVRCA